MTLEVADKGVVVQRQEPQGVIFFRGGIDDVCILVGKAGKMYAVLLAEQGFVMFALSTIIYLYALILSRSHQELPRVVKIQRGDVSLVW